MSDRKKFNVPPPSCIEGPPIPWVLTPEKQKGLFFSEEKVVPEFPREQGPAGERGLEGPQGPAGDPGEQGPPADIDGPLIPLMLTPEKRKGLFSEEKVVIEFEFPESMEVVKDD